MQHLLFLTVLFLAGTSLLTAQHGISEDMLNTLRAQGVNIDGPVPPMTATSISETGIDIDYSATRGELVHFERYNNLSHSEAFAEQRDADMEFYNEIGLHGKVYRVWMEQNRFFNEQTGKVEFHEMVDYLNDASQVTDYLMVNCNHLGPVTDWELSEQEAVDRLATIFSALKTRWPKVKYLEVTNEPDYSGEGFTPDNYYEIYRIYYQAVNKVNDDLQPEVPLQVGGPSTAQFSLEWMNGFLDDYKADKSKSKRLDFISYHGYFVRPDSAYILFKDNPSLVHDQRERLNEVLRAQGIQTDIPVFITEMGLYPGPSFDDYPTMRYDHLRQAAGIPSLFYWYLEDEHTYPFNWVFRHQTEGRKDQLVSRNERGEPYVHTGKLTPYGNMLLMMSMMKQERLEVELTDSIVAGKGVYAMAAKDSSGLSVLVWNFQGTATEGYNVSLNLKHLAGELNGGKAVLKTYRIDKENSNYHTNLDQANLQLTGKELVDLQDSFSTSLRMDPNSLCLLILEPQ